MVEFADNFAVVNPLFCKWVGNSSTIAQRSLIIYNTSKTPIYTKYIKPRNMFVTETQDPRSLATVLELDYKNWKPFLAL